MSDSTYESTPSGGTGASGSSTADTAKHEAGEVASTAKQEAGHVAQSAKQEAGAVAREAKSQTRELYAQTTHELREQAGRQQERVADGLRALAGELGSMADRSDQPGVGADVVRQVSQKADEIGEWLGQRDPGSLLHEVKSFARRKPGVFIGAAAIAGLAVGRLTRALAQGAPESGASAGLGAGTSGAPARRATSGGPVTPTTGSSAGAPFTPTPDAPLGGGPGVGQAATPPAPPAPPTPPTPSTPVYDQFAPPRTGAEGGARDDRPDAL